MKWRPSVALESLESRLLLTGDVGGTVYHDLNENGVRDPGADEPGLEGWTVFVDTNNDGILNAGEPTQVTDIDGDYLITGVVAGTYNIYEIPISGWAPSPGSLDHQLVTIVDDDEAKVQFGNVIAQVGSIEGTVWNDANGDGI